MRTQLTILLVESDRALLSAFGAHLANDGHAVFYATNADSALKIASEFEPQVVFVATSLPNADGYALAREVRARMYDACSIVTLGTDRSRPTRGDMAIVDFELRKPVDHDQLCDLVQYLHARRCLANHRGDERTI